MSKDRLDVARVVLQAVGGALAITLFEVEKATLQLHLGNYTAWILFLLLASFSVGAGVIGDFMLNNIFLLRLAITRKGNIEGYYEGFAWDSLTGRVVNFSACRIYYQDGHFRYDGIAEYTATGRIIEWQTSQSERSGDRLIYRYETFWHDDPSSREFGVGEIQFVRLDGRIAYYQGKFIDYRHKHECTDRAHKVSYSWFERRPATSMERLAESKARSDARIEKLRSGGLLIGMEANPNRSPIVQSPD